MTILCSCDIAANSLSHSSNKTAHNARSRVRLLLVIVETVTFDDVLVSSDEYGRLSFDIESNDVLPDTDDGFSSRTVVFGDPVECG